MGATSTGSGVRAALLIIDVQRGIFERSTPVHDGEALIDTISGLAQTARDAGVVVVFVQHANKMLEPGTAAWELHEGMCPADGDVLIGKTHGDAFEDTDLDAILKGRAVDTLFVTGLVTGGCVRATSLGARERGYRVFLVSDAHSSYHRDAAHRIAEWNEKLAGELDGVFPSDQVKFTAVGTG